MPRGVAFGLRRLEPPLAPAPRVAPELLVVLRVELRLASLLVLGSRVPPDVEPVLRFVRVALAALALVLVAAVG